MKTRILYEDKDILVCEKPAGLAVQSGRLSEPDMVSELKNYLAKGGRPVVSASGAGAGVRCGLPAGRNPVYLGVIHRLDQPVSGILVFAKTRRAAANLSGQVSDRRMEKTYRAIVMKKDEVRWPGSEEGVKQAAEDREKISEEYSLCDYMVKEAGGGARIAMPDEKEAKQARLVYRCLDDRDGRALLEIALKTGRHHQIRLQMAHAGMPLLGDNRYGTEESRRLSQQLGIRSIRLQAVKLCFYHPSTGKKVSYELDKKMEL